MRRWFSHGTYAVFAHLVCDDTNKKTISNAVDWYQLITQQHIQFVDIQNQTPWQNIYWQPNFPKWTNPAQRWRRRNSKSEIFKNKIIGTENLNYILNNALKLKYYFWALAWGIFKIKFWNASIWHRLKFKCMTFGWNAKLSILVIII